MFWLLLFACSSDKSADSVGVTPLDSSPTDSTGPVDSQPTEDSVPIEDTHAEAQMFTALVTDVDGLVDAAPSPDGQWMYFGANGASPGVWRIAMVPGTAGPVAPPDDTASGAALLAPVDGVASISTDGESVYVAGGDVEGVLQLDAGSGSVTPIDGLIHMLGSSILSNFPRGRLADGAVLLVGGTDTTGAAGMASVVSYDGTIVTVVGTWEGSPPTGLAAGLDGTIYAATSTDIRAISGGQITVLAEGLRLGSPAGLAMSPDGTLLLCSGVDETGHSEVRIIELATGAQSTVNEGISENVGSGGLHQSAEGVGTYGWAGYTGGGRGTVYQVEL